MSRTAGFLLSFALLGLAHSSLQAGPGEKGRPKILPKFEHWAGNPKPDARGNVPEIDHLAQLGELHAYDLEGKKVLLKSLWAEKPVLLVHSSVTCPISRDNCPHVDRILDCFGKQLEVVVIYTTEAHPQGAPSPYSEGGNAEWLTDRNVVEDILVDEPATIEARILRAKEYRHKMSIVSRMIVDSMDNQVWKFFGGGPNTGVLISRAGQIVSRQPWLKPSLMAGSIRSLVGAERNAAIRQKMEAAEVELYGWTPASVKDAIEEVPELVHYLEQSRGNVYSWLHRACESGELEIAEVLLRAGAPVDIQDEEGKTPLHEVLASSPRWNKRSEAVIRFLLEHGADPLARSDDLRYGLHYAVDSGIPAHVQFLLEGDVAMDLASIDGITPLHEALYRGHQEIVALLKKAGAVIDIHAAAGLGDLREVKRYLNAKPESWARFQGDSGRSPLIYAIIAGQTEMVKFLLSQQTKTLRYSNEHLSACLSKAIGFDHTEATLAILPQALPTSGELAPAPNQSLHPQIPPDLRFWGYFEPLLHDAASQNNHQVIARLLKRGWDVHDLDADEETPLHRAAQFGGIESVRLLLEHGAKLEAKSGEERELPCGVGSEGRLNRTPLHHAVMGRKVESVRYLLKKGAKVNAIDYRQTTPVMFLLPASEDDDTKEMEAILRLLVEAGADLNRKDFSGATLRERASEMIPLRKKIDGRNEIIVETMRRPELVKLLDALAK